MRKKIRNLHLGFTIAELLISLLVVMVVAVALAPVIGPKKLKIPRLTTNHGIYECYWKPDSEDSSNMVLYEHMANDSKQSYAARQVDGDHCTFTAPSNASFFTVYVIGAGSAGFGADPVTGEVDMSQLDRDWITINTKPNADASGNIRLDDNFQRDLEDANKKLEAMGIDIKSYINDWAYCNGGSNGSGVQNCDRTGKTSSYLNFVVNKILSPVGASGKSKLEATTSGSGCNYTNYEQYRHSSVSPYNFGWYDNVYLPGSKCFYLRGAKGQDSGIGGTVNGPRFPIDADSQITIQTGTEDYAGVKTTFNNRNYELRYDSSGSGRDAEPGIDTSGRADNASLSQVNMSSYNGTSDGRQNLGEYESLNTILQQIRQNSSSYSQDNNNPATPGEVRYDQNGNTISWSYMDLVATMKYGSAGTAGDQIPYYLPNMKGNYYLFPAKVSDINVAPSSVISIEESRDNQAKYIAEAESKRFDNNTNILKSIETVLDNSTIPSPSFETFADANATANAEFTFFTDIREVLGKIRGYNSEIVRMCEDGTYCPGFAGPGFIPLVTNDIMNGNQPGLQMKKGSSPAKNWGANSNTVPQDVDENGYNEHCKNQNQNAEHFEYNGKHFCKTGNQRRGEGAIIIIW